MASMGSVSVVGLDGAAAVDDCLCPVIHVEAVVLGRDALYLGRIEIVEMEF